MEAIEEAIRTRALVMLGALAEDAATKERLAAEFTSAADNRRRGAAAAALLAAGEERLVVDWIRGIRSAEERRVAFGLLSNHEYAGLVNGLGGRVEYPHTTACRALDETLLHMAQTLEPAENSTTGLFVGPEYPRRPRSSSDGTRIWSACL